MSWNFNASPPPYVPTARGPDHAQLAQAQALEGTTTFAVSATFRGAPKPRKGQLFVSPEAIVFIAGNSRFEHEGREITLVDARLCPPWANTFLFLEDKHSRVLVAAPASARHRLRKALRDAGVTVNEQTSSRAPSLPRRGPRRA